MRDTIVFSTRSDDVIHVGFGFSYFNQDCPETFEWRGDIYDYGMLTAIPNGYANELCSCREYKKRPRRYPRRDNYQYRGYQLCIFPGGSIGVIPPDEHDYVQMNPGNLEQAKRYIDFAIQCGAPSKE